MRHSKSVLLSCGILGWSSLLWTPPVHAQTTVDLSLDWQEGPLYNQNKGYCAIQAALAPTMIHGYVVVQDGLLVAEGYTKRNDADDLSPVFSVTKAWSTFLIGVVVDQGKLTISDTLGDIFNKDNDWHGVSQAEEKKTITVQEILTMSSGLSEKLGVLVVFNFNNQDSLQKVLDMTKYDADQRGKFEYLAATHTLAHIIHRRTGESPRAFAMSSGIFAALGITEEDFEWDTYGDVEGSAGGLRTNPRVLAKLGQLYLQQGASSPRNQLVSSHWVTMATTNWKEPDSPSVSGQIFDGYGYHWKMPLDGGSGARAGIAATSGAFGNYIVFLPVINTVIAVMGETSCPVAFYNSVLFIDAVIENLDGFTKKTDDDCEDDFSKWKYCTRSAEHALYCTICLF